MMQSDVEFIEIPSKYIDRVIGNYNPVVIVTTRNANGDCNAAPYAMCMEVCHNPPLFALGVGKTKDTYHNIKANHQFVVNVPGQDIIRKLMVTALRYPPEVNELVEADLHELPGLQTDVSRVKECKLHFECQVEWIKEAGNHFIVLGKVLSATASREVLTDDYRVRFESLRPFHYVGRGTDTFLETGKSFIVKRGSLEE